MVLPTTSPAPVWLSKPLVIIPQRWLAPPQFGGAAVEILDHTRGIAGIDGHGTHLEQGAIALFAFVERRLRQLALGDFAPQFGVQCVCDADEFLLAQRTE